MGMALKITPEGNFLRVCVSGQFSLADANEAFVEMLEAVRQHNATKVLVDCTGLSGSPSQMDRYEHSKFGAITLLESSAFGIRFGYVATEPILDPGKFGETVAVNRLVKVRVYDNMEDALRWLGIDPANKALEGDSQ